MHLADLSGLRVLQVLRESNGGLVLREFNGGLVRPIDLFGLCDANCALVVLNHDLQPHVLELGVRSVAKGSHVVAVGALHVAAHAVEVVISGDVVTDYLGDIDISFS